MTQASTGFWSSLQGILTGIAAVITAVTGLYLAIKDESPPKVIEPKVAAVVEQVVSPVVPMLSAPQHATSVSTASAVTLKPLAELQAQAERVKQFSKVGNSIAAVDCGVFPTVNTSKSLMSWSTYYHQQIIDAQGVKARAITPCYKTIAYRAQAYCSNRTDIAVQNALIETLNLCEQVGVSWKEVGGNQ
jgi:hypothetical protein